LSVGELSINRLGITEESGRVNSLFIKKDKGVLDADF
jgi:hypothetical protein